MSDAEFDVEPLGSLTGAGQTAMLRMGAADKMPQAHTARQVAHDFEAVLLQRLFEEMRRTIPDSGLLDSGISDQVQGMFWLYLAQDVAAKGGIGLWQEMERQIQHLAPDPSAHAAGDPSAHAAGDPSAHAAGAPPAAPTLEEKA
jgi:Rod binding domain-containing protein